MRLLVVSDTHGNRHALEQVVWAHPEVRTVIHLGDGAREAEDVAADFPEHTFYLVKGNGDSALLSLPELREETFGGKRVLFTHGHLHNVKFGIQRLHYAAQERAADVVLFGHTHQPLSLYEDGIYLVNPGSLGYDRRYALLDIVPGGILPILHSLH